jgi:5-formyltetrahydrofolate cyclo-ligase
MSLAEEKRLARTAALARRDAVATAASAGAGEALSSRGLPPGVGPRPRVISGFHPYLSEISTLPFLSRLADAGWVTVLPVVVAKNTPLAFRQWRPGEPLVKGRWDIDIPPETAAAHEPDVLLVPMLAFDRRGYRLGYGGGFYDRTLQKLRQAKPVVAIGVAYAGQEVADVVHDDLDQRLDWIMTETETIRCG